MPLAPQETAGQVADGLYWVQLSMFPKPAGVLAKHRNDLLGTISEGGESGDMLVPNNAARETSLRCRTASY